MDNPFEDINMKLKHVIDMITDLKQSIQPKDITYQQLVKIEEVVKITGYKKGYIYELVYRNAIPYIRKGRSLRFDPGEIDRWMRAGRPNVMKETIRSFKEPV